MHSKLVKLQTLLLPLALLVTMLLPLPAYAAEGDTTAQDTVATQAYEEKVSDPNTFNAWYDTQAYNTATTGRIWADKTVDTEEIKFNKGQLAGQSIPMADDADFQVALSALSSTSNTSGFTAVPLDIVMVLDVSGSMAEDFGKGGQTKLASLKTAVNNFLDEAAEVNKGISDDDKKINVSLVKFAGNKNDNIGDDTYDVTTGFWPFETTDTYNLFANRQTAHYVQH